MTDYYTPPDVLRTISRPAALYRVQKKTARVQSITHTILKDKRRTSLSGYSTPQLRRYFTLTLQRVNHAKGPYANSEISSTRGLLTTGSASGEAATTREQSSTAVPIPVSAQSVQVVP